MTPEQLFQDKTIKAKGKVATLGGWLMDGTLSIEALITFAEKQKASDKATCIEAIEFATKKQSTLADTTLLAYVTERLQDDEPRVKWESAKVIGNIAKHFPDKLENSIAPLLRQAANNGTVVRWAAASALAEILKLKTAQYTELLPKIETLCAHEADNGVKKKYLDAIKKVKK